MPKTLAELLGVSENVVTDVVSTQRVYAEYRDLEVTVEKHSGLAAVFARMVEAERAQNELVAAATGLLDWRLPHDRAFTVTDGSRAAFDRLEAALAALNGRRS